MDRDDLTAVIGAVMDKIEEHEDGDRISISELIKEIGMDAGRCSTEDLFEITSSIYDAAEDRNIRLDNSKFDGMAVGLPFNIPFVIRKSE